MPVDLRPTVAAPDDDRYLWLEEIGGVRAMARVGRQNGATLARFGTTKSSDDRDTLAGDTRPSGQNPFSCGCQHVHKFWRDRQASRRIASLGGPVDVDLLAARENERLDLSARGDPARRGVAMPPR